MSIGQEIKKYRNITGLTQQAFGRLMEVSGPTVSRWEKGIDEPTKDNLAKIQVIFDNQPTMENQDVKMIDPKQLKHWRKVRMGVTRSQLAEVLGLTGQTIFRWESLEKPFVVNRKSLKDLLDLMANPDAYDLLRRNEEAEIKKLRVEIWEL